MAKITTITTSILLLLFQTLTTTTTQAAAAAAATTITITAAPSTPSTAPSYTNDETFTSAILNSTNTYRTQHNASSLIWNATLALFARTYLFGGAVGADCRFAHSGGPYGENLALGYASASAAVEAWGDEGDDYDYERPGFSERTGHFSQLVWKDTTDVGCARRSCGGRRGWYLACEYWPPGNVIGAFGGEVDRALNAAGGRRRRGGGSWGVVVGVVVVWMVLL